MSIIAEPISLGCLATLPVGIPGLLAQLVLPLQHTLAERPGVGVDASPREFMDTAWFDRALGGGGSWWLQYPEICQKIDVREISCDNVEQDMVTETGSKGQGEKAAA